MKEMPRVGDKVRVVRAVDRSGLGWNDTMSTRISETREYTVSYVSVAGRYVKLSGCEWSYPLECLDEPLPPVAEKWTLQEDFRLCRVESLNDPVMSLTEIFNFRDDTYKLTVEKNNHLAVAPVQGLGDIPDALYTRARAVFEELGGVLPDNRQVVFKKPRLGRGGT